MTSGDSRKPQTIKRGNLPHDLVQKPKYMKIICKSNFFVQIRKSKVCLIRLTVGASKNDPYVPQRNGTISNQKPTENKHPNHKRAQPQNLIAIFEFFSDFLRSESYDRDTLSDRNLSILHDF